jgi:hypothetical protein
MPKENKGITYYRACQEKKHLSVEKKYAIFHLTFAKDPQWRLEGQLGFIGVLHTWSQTLIDHFHIHCIIPVSALCFLEN